MSMDSLLKATVNVHCKEGKRNRYSGSIVRCSQEQSSLWQGITSNWQSPLRSARNNFHGQGEGQARQTSSRTFGLVGL